tara:strand:- start:111 stop:287 length:177 start_codon:yes stop_codon:yes gene_type:complete
VYKEDPNGGGATQCPTLTTPANIGLAIIPDWGDPPRAIAPKVASLTARSPALHIEGSW